jgi:CubicO group peptidase (beta-lactamase class C family)/predicted aspartyl protease
MTLLLALWLSIASDLTRAADTGNFSGVVLLAQDGKPVLLKAWGANNKNDTKFNLGSINKIFTQVAIGQLAQAGKLGLDDNVRKHLPDYPSPIADRITIRQLIEHRSGMGDFFGPEYLATPPAKIRKLSDYLPLFVNKPLEFEPGTDQRYSNAGFIVLGLIIERESGRSYYDFVRDHIFKPAGMKDTDSYAIDEKVPNRATALTKHESTELPGRGSSAGGGYSTAGDLLRFAQALRSGKLLDEKWTGWVFRDDKQRKLAIAGGSPGVNAVMLIGSPYALVVLSNLDPPAAEQIAQASGLAPRRSERRQAEPEEVLISGPVDIPMTFERHVPVIEAKLNGKGPFKFEVDTGFGGMIEVSPALAQQLAMPVVGEAVTGDPTGRAPKKVRVMRAESFDVDKVHFGGVDVVEGRNSEVDGIIGLNLFRSLLVTFDYPNSRFQLHGGALPADAMAYSAEHGVPSVEIDVAGQKFNVDIDSGSPGEVTLPLSAAKTLPLASEPVVVGRGMTADGPFEVLAAPLKGDVHVGTITLTNPHIDFVSVFPHGNIGSRFLKGRAVTFDPKNGRLAFARPSS